MNRVKASMSKWTLGLTTTTAASKGKSLLLVMVAFVIVFFFQLFTEFGVVVRKSQRRLTRIKRAFCIESDSWIAFDSLTRCFFSLIFSLFVVDVNGVELNTDEVELDATKEVAPVTLEDLDKHNDDDDEDEMEQEEMFVTPHDSFEFRETMEWGGPRRGGRLPEPTRYGDWERKGRCTDF